MLPTHSYFNFKVIFFEAMGRKEKDLWLILADPAEARRYIKEFDWNCPPEWRPTKVILDSGREVILTDMTDADAVAAAMAILRDVEIPMIIKEKNLTYWEH